MPSNSNPQKCEKVKQEAKKGKFLGKGAFGEVREHGAHYVIKTEKCKSGFRKKASEFVPNVTTYRKVLSSVIKAGLAPPIKDAYECGDTCITIMKKAPGQTLTNSLHLPHAPEIIESVYKGIRKLHSLMKAPYGHGDLHSSNVLVHKTGNKWKPKFIDFALERKLARSYDWKFMRDSISQKSPKYKELTKSLEHKYSK